MINISRIKVAKPRKLPTYGTGAFHTEQQFCFELGYKEGVAATRKAIREALKEEASLNKEIPTAVPLPIPDSEFYIK